MAVIEAFAKRTLGQAKIPGGGKPKMPGMPSLEEDDPAHENGNPHVTTDELLADGRTPPEQKSWLASYKQGGEEWAHANNPPNFVTDEALWEKAKSAAEQAGADDIYAFANWWYREHGG